MNPFVIVSGLTLVGVLVAVGAQATNIQTAIDNLEYSIESLELIKKESDIFSTKLKLKLNLVNPTNTTIAFEGLKVDLLQGGKKLTGVNTTQNINIKARSGSNVAISVLLSNAVILNQLLDIASKNQKISDLVQVKGIIRYNGLDLPINETINLKEA